MPEYLAPLKDMQFLLQRVFNAEKLWPMMPNTEEVTMDLAVAILDEAAKISQNTLAPANRDGDEEGASRQQDGSVSTPEGFKKAAATFMEGGWYGLGGDPEYGGQGMPKMLTVFMEEMLYASNSAFALYYVLTAGAALAIARHANEEIKNKYLPSMYDGRFSGTMCLTEPHSGTDLGILRTKAEPNGDGSYNVSGTKIFITYGEHDLSQNIVHLVLAKLPDAPAGSKGISLFVVPKYLVNDDLSNGDFNNVSCGSIEEKMGIHGSPTCVMNFDGSKGWLVGEPNQGLAAMFTMMNYERLSIGIQGLGAADASYQNASTYAKERLQGRAATGPANPDKNADPIIVHADVRRMLLTQRALVESARAFSCYVGMQLDIVKSHPDSAIRDNAKSLVELLTPVAKAFISDKGFDACVLGQQVFGGHGYVREWGQEQLVRDTRIAQIYEGTNGVQAMDLMGRKTVRSNGALLEVFATEVNEYIDSLDNNDQLTPFVNAAKDTLSLVDDTTKFILSNVKSDPNLIGSSAVDYLHLLGYACYSYMWVRMVNTVLTDKEVDAQYKDAKIKVGQFFLARLLPQAESLANSIKGGSACIMDLDQALF